jgi:hypothetical protein
MTLQHLLDVLVQIASKVGNLKKKCLITTVGLKELKKFSHNNG